MYLHIYAQREHKKELADSPIFVGEIHAGKKKNPRPLEENQRLLLLGDDLAIITDGSQNSVLSKQGKSFLSIGVDANGLMTLSATVSDSKNNNVVKIINNEFQASQEFAFLPKQPDKNSIIVRDSDGVEVLNVTFINRQTMRITGRFIIPDSSEPIVISNIDGIRWPGGGGISHLTLDIKGQGGVMDFD